MLQTLFVSLHYKVVTKQRYKMATKKGTKQRKKTIQTEYRQTLNERNRALYSDFTKMVETDGQPISVAVQALMKKYNIHSSNTIYNIRKIFEKGGQKA